jgi:hypothetical protein
VPPLERRTDLGIEPAGVTRLAYDVRARAASNLSEEVFERSMGKFQTGRQLHQQDGELLAQPADLVEEAR